MKYFGRSLRKNVMAIFVVMFFGLSFVQVAPVSAAGQCFCYAAGKNTSGCKTALEAECAVTSATFVGDHFDKCDWKPDEAACDKAFSDWSSAQERASAAAAGPASGGVAASKSKFIPDCVLDNNLPTDSSGAVTGPCGDVSIFVWLLLNASNYLFTIIGAIALAMFVYGGFLMIISQGSEEKITKGTDAIKAAVIGLVIAFGGYFLIRFLGEAIGLKEAFRLQ